jgi:hypothetical protein
MPYDYSDAPPPREFELIPHGTIATVTMHLRPGGAGEDGMLRRSRDGGCEMLDAVFTVVDGPFARRKFFGNMVLAGTTGGHDRAAEISRSTLRSILESARGIKPDDMSPQARTARTASLKDFDNLTFIAKIGIEKGGPRNDGKGDKYDDKNILAAVITPDKKEWRAVEQPPPFDGGSGGVQAAPANTAPPVEQPEWARS